MAWCSQLYHDELLCRVLILHSSCAQVSYNLTGTGLLPFGSSQQSGFGSALVQTLGSGYSGVTPKYLGSVVSMLPVKESQLHRISVAHDLDSAKMSASVTSAKVDEHCRGPDLSVLYAAACGARRVVLQQE